MVREFSVEPQYKLKSRNLIFKILDNPDVLKRNDQSKLIIICIALTYTKLNALFISRVRQDYN